MAYYPVTVDPYGWQIDTSHDAYGAWKRYLGFYSIYSPYNENHVLRVEIACEPFDAYGFEVKGFAPCGDDVGGCRMSMAWGVNSIAGHSRSFWTVETGFYFTERFLLDTVEYNPGIQHVALTIEVAARDEDEYYWATDVQTEVAVHSIRFFTSWPGG